MVARPESFRAMSKYPEPLVSAAWLIEHIHDGDIRIFDATYHMPTTGRSAANEIPEKHLPYAHFFDIERVADPETDVPHMLPKPDAFTQSVESMGMGSDHFAVVYDVHGLMSAARLWWMFRIFGHDRVAVLDGGLPAWIAAGGTLESGPARQRDGEPHFHARFRPELVRSREEVLTALQDPSTTIVDARGAGRFNGTAVEPRPGVRQGHIPGSRNLPYTELLDQSGKFLPQAALRERFEGVGIAIGAPVVSTCGSGVTACVLALGLAQLGQEIVPVYDGSWSEWGADLRCPIE